MRQWAVRAVACIATIGLIGSGANAARAEPKADRHVVVHHRPAPAVDRHRTHAPEVAPKELVAKRRGPTAKDLGPIYIRRAFTVPNDPGYAQLQKDYLAPLHLPEAWSVARGTGVTIAVLDTGVNPVSDLAGRVLP